MAPGLGPRGAGPGDPERQVARPLAAPSVDRLPLGCWASASLLDLLGLGRHRDAARRLVGLGLLASLPTAAAGLSDWSRLATPDRRVGLVHAQLNTLVLALYGA